MLRLAVPLNIKGKYIGQTAFGTDELFMDGRENVSHRFVAVQEEENCLAILNNSLYASMYKDNTIYLSLVRGAGYCVHPIPNRPLLSDISYVNRVDQCEHNFSFRFTVAKVSDLERLAMEFNQAPYALNTFPVISENREYVEKNIRIDNKNVVLVAMKQSVDGKRYIFRLMNNQDADAKATLFVDEMKLELQFGKYEVRTVLLEGKLEECAELII